MNKRIVRNLVACAGLWSFMCLWEPSLLANPPVKAPEQAPLVKVIDLRVKAETSALYVVFCARWDTMPGHSFVVLGKEDAAAQMSTVDAFGYYPEKPGDLRAVFKKVPGLLADEFVRGTLAPTLVRLILKVNRSDFDAVEAVRRTWASRTNFQLIEQDCVTFVMDVARALKLRVPDRSGLDNIPWKYLGKLAEANDQSQYLDGVWESTDSAKRFRLEIVRMSCSWTERNAGGSELKRMATLVEDAKSFRISRPNDTDVLTFLGFQPSLRTEILARGPQPSFILLSRPNAETIIGHWNGLLAIKDNSGKLKELKQPGTTPAKQFEFKRVL
jgi:hypothetical protein